MACSAAPTCFIVSFILLVYLWRSFESFALLRLRRLSSHLSSVNTSLASLRSIIIIESKYLNVLYHRLSQEGTQSVIIVSIEASITRSIAIEKTETVYQTVELEAEKPEPAPPHLSGKPPAEIAQQSRTMVL